MFCSNKFILLRVVSGKMMDDLEKCIWYEKLILTSDS